MEGEHGFFWSVARPTRLPLEVQYDTGFLLRCDGTVGIPFQTKQGNRLSIRDQKGRRGSDEVMPGNSVFLSRETDVSGYFLSCMKGVKYRFECQE